jgi:hypothetical protein
MNKTKILVDFAKQLGFSLRDFVLFYKDQKFKDTNLDKAVLFSNLLLDRLTKDEASYLSSKLNLPHKDNRTPIEYGKELVISWLIEDIVSKYLILSANGADAERDFLNESEIKYASDFLINGRHLELYVSWTTYWTSVGKIDLRLDKYLNLLENRALLLGISILDKKFFLMDFSKNDYGFQQEYNLHWKKRCWTCRDYQDFIPIEKMHSVFANFV